MPERHHARHNKRLLRQRRRRQRVGMMIVGVTILAVGVAIALQGGDGDPPVVSGSPAQLELGATVFEANCATCHGESLRGGMAGPPLIDEIYRPGHHPDDAIRAAIANGVTPHHWDFAGMPPIRGLDAEEVDAVIAYIRDVQEAAWSEAEPGGT